MMVRETERGSFIIDRRAQRQDATEVVMLAVAVDDLSRLLFVLVNEWQLLSARAREVLSTAAGVVVYGRGSVVLADAFETLGDLVEATEAADLPGWVRDELAKAQEQLGQARGAVAPENDAELYYIQNVEWTIGFGVVWRMSEGIDGTAELNNARLFTRAEALEIASACPGAVPYARRDIEAIASRSVDVGALYDVEPLTGGEA